MTDFSVKSSQLQFSVSGYLIKLKFKPVNFTDCADSLTEWLQWEERGAPVPVYGLARPWGARVPHPHLGLPKAGKGLQSSRCRTYGGSLQVGTWDYLFLSEAIDKDLKITSNICMINVKEINWSLVAISEEVPILSIIFLSWTVSHLHMNGFDAWHYHHHIYAVPSRIWFCFFPLWMNSNRKNRVFSYIKDWCQYTIKDTTCNRDVEILFWRSAPFLIPHDFG